jgi:hypothetical protein
VLKRAVVIVLLLLCFAGPVVLWAKWPTLHPRLYNDAAWDETKVDKYGQFGDSYGALNAIFSGCAFVAVAVTLILQMIELEMQRKETHSARNAQQQSEHRSNVFKMFEMWSSDYMRRHRAVAHPAVYRRGTRVQLPSEPADVRSSVDVVCHFFRDLGILFDSGLVDRELACRLFGDDVEHWLPMLNDVNFDDDQLWYDEGARRILDYFRRHCPARQAEPGAAADRGRM